MAVDITVPRSRRALLGAALGALAATGAHALGRPIAARAANGDPLLVGNGNSATAETQLTHSGLGIRSLYVLRSDVTSTGAAFVAEVTSPQNGSSAIGGLATAGPGRPSA